MRSASFAREKTMSGHKEKRQAPDKEPAVETGLTLLALAVRPPRRAKQLRAARIDPGFAFPAFAYDRLKECIG
ncbi:hypothetical protein CDO73_22805 [Saccharibacillus sp. O23]|nr:hypothetical protein CDO73_22805 [Saccharibacillus sp. O23]